MNEYPGLSLKELAERAPLGNQEAGKVSPELEVPKNIERPEYLFHDGPEKVTASDTKSPETVEKIRAAGQIAADALVAVGKAIRPLSLIHI